MAILDGSEFNAGQYGPQSVFDRGRVGMMAEFRGQSGENAIQTLQMNDQLMRSREQDMHLKALEAQQASQLAAKKVQDDQATRMNEAYDDVHSFLGTSGKQLISYIDDGNDEAVGTTLSMLAKRNNITMEELNQILPQENLRGYTQTVFETTQSGNVYDDPTQHELLTKKEEQFRGEDIATRKDYRQAGISRDVVAAEQAREEIVILGGKFEPEDIALVYDTGTTTTHITNHAQYIHSALDKILPDSDFKAGGPGALAFDQIDPKSKTYKFGAAMNRQYNTYVQEATREWNDLTRVQKALNLDKKPRSQAEYQALALRNTVYMTTKDGNPQAFETAALKKDRKTFLKEVLRHPEAEGIVTIAIEKAKSTRQYNNAATEEQRDAIVEKLVTQALYSDPVARGMVIGSERSSLPRQGGSVVNQVTRSTRTGF